MIDRRRPPSSSSTVVMLVSATVPLSGGDALHIESDWVLDSQTPFGVTLSEQVAVRGPSARDATTTAASGAPRVRRPRSASGSSTSVHYVTIYRWVQRFTPEFVEAARTCRHVPGDRWFDDQT